MAQPSRTRRAPAKHIAFTLPPHHVDKDSKSWRRDPASRRRTTSFAKAYWSNAKTKKAREARVREGVLNGTIPSAAWDTACTSNAGKPGDPFLPTARKSSKVFALADGRPAPASEEAKLHHAIREPARTVDMVPALRGNSLLSGGKFAEAGYISICDGEEVNIYDGRTARIQVSEEAVLKGWRCPHTNLWRIPLRADVTSLNDHTLLLDGPGGTDTLHLRYSVPSSAEMLAHIELFSKPDPAEAINNLYELPSVERAVRYLHAAAGFPTKATWLKAIRNGHYVSWPLLTVKHVNKYFPESEETQKGHMRSQRQGVRSTKRRASGESADDPADPPAEAEAMPAPIEKKRDIFIKTFEPRSTLFTDQTGRFPQQSSRGNNYQMILYHIDSNSTWVEPMRDRTEGELIAARRRGVERMKKRGIEAGHQVLDNEVSKAYKDEITTSGMTFQLVPPDDHRRNLAEKAIQTWKDHFIGVLSGTAETFPLHLWCQAIPQMERQLLLLQRSNVNPSISAYSHVYGQHNYDAAPFVPIGMESLVHEKPRRRRTFAEHCKKGYVLGTAFDHYRSWVIWMTDTRATRVSGTVFHKHKYITNPAVTPADAVIAAAGRLAAVIKGTLSNSMGTDALDELARLGAVFTNAAATAPKEEQAPRPRPAIVPPARPAPRRSPRLLPEAPAAPRLRAPPAQPDPLPLAPTAPSPAAVPRVAPPPRVVQPPRVEGTPSPAPPPRVEAPRRSPRLEQSPPREETAPPDAPAFNTRSRTRAARPGAERAMFAAADVNRDRLSPRRLASRYFPIEMINAVLDEDTGELMEYRAVMRNPKYRPLYAKSYTKELGRLAQGVPGLVKGTDTIVFITKKDVPLERWRDVTYGRVVIDYRPEKSDPYRTRLTVGGDKINYPGDCGTPTVDLLTVKLLLNSVISTAGAKFMTIDIKDFYLNTPMARYEYMRLKLSDLPEDIVEHYRLAEKVATDGYVYVEIRRGMYGLPHAGLIANRLLEKRLNLAGYRQSTLTPGLWKHDWRPISFTLCVDDFGVKYVGQEHADHLQAVLRQHYTISTDPKGRRYLGIDLDWDYENRTVHLSMLKYVPQALTRFKHRAPKKPQHQPHPHVKPKYGATKQYTPGADTSPLLSKEDKKYVQEVVGTFLYYARAVDCTMLPALSTIATQQANPTERTLAKVKQFLDYAATHPDAIITYRASNMVLVGHSDASYLSESNARSRAGGHFFLSRDTEDPPNNGPVLTISQIIKHVMSSAAEAELGALYINCREAIPARHALEYMGHKQPPTPM